MLHITDVTMNDNGTTQIPFANCVPNTQENSDKLITHVEF